MVEVSTLSPVPSDSVTGIAPWVRIVREPGAPHVFARSERPMITGPRQAAQLIAEHIENEEQEVMVVLSLDVQMQVIAYSQITRGLLDQTMVHPREVFRIAIALGAYSIVIAHNHPSGIAVPSPADREVTAGLLAAGKIVGIPLMDSLVIGSEGRYTSFAEAGLL